MQQQLQDLQPELIQTSEETKLLMVKIEKDTIEAEAKKEVHFDIYVFVIYKLRVYTVEPLLKRIL